MSIFLFFCYIEGMLKQYAQKLKRPCIIIAISALIISLAYSFCIQTPLNVDAKAHQRIALNIMQGKGYWEQMPPNKAFDPAIGRSGPLLEYMLAGIYCLFGIKIWIVWTLHAIMHALAAFLIYKICLLLFLENQYKEKIGLIAMSLFGFYPDLIESASMLMAETSYIFLAILLIYLFCQYNRNRSVKTLVMFSIIAALSFLAKSTIALSSIAFIIYFFKEKKHKELILVSLIVIALASPWIIRNYFVFNKFIPSRIYGFYTLYNGNYHGASGENDIELLPDALKIKEEQGVFAVEEYAKKQFLSFIREHPLEYVYLHIKRLLIYFSWLRPTGHWPYLTYWQKLITYLSSGLFSIMIFTLGMAGLWQAYKNQKENKALQYLILFTILTPLPFLLTLVETRYRYPIYPLLAIFSGYFMVNKLNKKYCLLAIVFLLLFINALVDLSLNWQRFWDQLT